MTTSNTVETERLDPQKAVILVVEDEFAMRELMKAYLEVEGFLVITAANGVDGLQTYKENKDRVRIVVTDLDMPAMNGSDMIRQIFEITPAMKVIVASGHGFSYARANVSSNDTRCLQKPYTGRELQEAVQLLL